MATWTLTRGLMTVRTEFNLVFKIRDRRSDGSIGDQSHATGTSGHNPDRTGRAEYRDGDAKNEVRAIDVDRDLVPGSGIDWMERVVQYIIKRARAGGYVPFRYIIYKRRIWARSDGWKTRAYTGANAHDQHAHFSGDYTEKADEWTGSLGLASLIGSPGGAGGNDDTMSVQDVRDYFASAAKGVRGDGSAQNIQDRKDLVDVLRFGWGLNYDQQTAANLAPARFSALGAAIAGLDSVDEAAIAAAITPGLVAAIQDIGGDLSAETVENALRTVLREGVGS